MYEREYQKSIKNSENYFALHARKLLTWDKDFTEVYNNEPSEAIWFADGMLNACYNVIDRNVKKTPNKLALIYDDNNGKSYRYTFEECLFEIMRVANFLEYATRNHTELNYVAIYMQTSPQAFFTALACARIGMPHNIIFGGFGSESIALRVKDSNAKIIFTNFEVQRETKTINFFESVMNANELLKKENYKLDCVIVYDLDKIEHVETDTPILLWNDILRNNEAEHEKENLSILKQKKCVNLESTTCNYTATTKYYNDMNKTLALHKFIPCKPVLAENPLFCIYTSGSTDKPKGLVHTTGGYLFYASFTNQKAYDVNEKSVFLCTGDLGWVAGATYSIYGVLSLGSAAVIMSGSPSYPNINRIFRMIHEYKISHIFTAPTVLRLIKQKYKGLSARFENRSLKEIYESRVYDCDDFFDNTENEDTNALQNKVTKLPDLPFDLFVDQKTLSADTMSTYNPASFYRKNTNFYVDDFDLSSLRTVIYGGEPLDRDAFYWCKSVFGPFIPFLPTYWQTEAGSCLITGISYKTYPIPECTGVPFFGIHPVIYPNNKRSGAIIFSGSWPGIARTIINDQERYKRSYFQVYPGYFNTGDLGCERNGIFYVQGRCDDVLKVSGHRLSSSEIENACCSVKDVAEAAAIGVDDSIIGQVIDLFCVKTELTKIIPKIDIINAIRSKIGPIVRVKEVYFVSDLPKTKTGKIMRRVLKSIIEDKPMGDLSTCANIESISHIRDVCKEVRNAYLLIESTKSQVNKLG